MFDFFKRNEDESGIKNPPTVDHLGVDCENTRMCNYGHVQNPDSGSIPGAESNPHPYSYAALTNMMMDAGGDICEGCTDPNLPHRIV